VQSGAFDLGAMLGKPGAKDGTQAAAEGGGIIVLPEAARDPYADAARAFLAKRSGELDAQALADWRLRSGLAWADPDSAARALEQLQPPVAAALLLKLPRRGIANIISAADPAVSSKWLDLMTVPQALPAVPDELKAQAARAGLYDNSSDLLADARRQAGASVATAEGGTGGAASQTPADPAASPPADPAAGGAAPGGQPPADATPATGGGP
jgi:hypothetical protein